MEFILYPRYLKLNHKLDLKFNNTYLITYKCLTHMKNEIQNKPLENSKQNVAMNSRAFSFLLLKIWPEIPLITSRKPLRNFLSLFMMLRKLWLSKKLQVLCYLELVSTSKKLH